MAAMTDALYTKCPLPPHPGHIRLLRLHPSSDPSAPLSGTIFATTFDASRGSYAALSYCWGDDARPETITLRVRNEEPRPGDSHTDQNTIPIQLPITRSLAEALADIRFQSSDRLLWADALCIDQAHNEEKPVQVRQMYDVYANSRRTLVYLGRGSSKGMQAAIAHRDYLRAVKARSEKSSDPLQAADTGTLVTWDPAVGVVRAGKGAPSSAGDKSDCLDYRTVAILPDTEADFLFTHRLGIVNSWRCILERPWTTRAWTTQEFVAGPDVLLQLGQGEVTLTLDDLFNLAQYLGYDMLWRISGLSSIRVSGPSVGGPSFAYHPLVRMETVACKVFWMMRLRLSVSEGDEAPPIGEVLGFLQGSINATVLNTRDARDVLWSLLPLSRDKAVEKLQPNYDLSVDEVYGRFSIHIATANESSYSVLIALPLQMQNGTPSWRLAPKLFKSRRIHYKQRLSSHKGIWASANEQGTELTVFGALVDRIDRLVERSEIDARGLAEDADKNLLFLSTAYSKMQEAASWPGLFVLPGESPEQAKIKFFRGMTSWRQPEAWERQHLVCNTSWEQYAHLWLASAVAYTQSLASERLIPGEPGSLAQGDLIDFEFLNLVRSKGWPMDMVRHYFGPDASDPSGFPSPGELTTEEACRTAMNVFLGTAWEHFRPFMESWSGKTVGMTSRGHLCNVDKEARVGDWIAVTASDPTAIILRSGLGGAYNLVGRAYAHGLMEGMEMYGDVEGEIRLC